MREGDELDSRTVRGLNRDEELPVVSRLVIEIRSDGWRTLARGAIEDGPTGTKVAMRASASSPLELALKLVRAMVSAPLLARGAARALRGKTSR